MHTVLQKHIPNKPQRADREGIPDFQQIGESGSSDVLAPMQLTYEGRNDRVTVLDVFSWLSAKEISIGGLEQIFIKHLNAHMKGNIRYYWKCNCCCRL